MYNDIFLINFPFLLFPQPDTYPYYQKNNIYIFRSIIIIAIKMYGFSIGLCPTLLEEKEYALNLAIFSSLLVSIASTRGSSNTLMVYSRIQICANTYWQTHPKHTYTFEYVNISHADIRRKHTHKHTFTPI